MARAVKEIQAHIDAELDQAQLEDLVSRLVDKRRDLAARVADLEQQIVPKDDCSLADAAEAASLQEARLRARGMIEHNQETIKEIDAALRRLGNGSYGVSEATGAPIAYDRLMLIPWARVGTDDRKS